MDVSIPLLASVVEHEGFRAYPYKDTQGVTTIGHGLTWISEPESLTVVQARLSELGDHLNGRLNFFKVLPGTVQDCLIEMAYQMGVEGLLQFNNMLHSMATEDWVAASEHGMESLWAVQTPERAQEMMIKLANTNIS